MPVSPSRRRRVIVLLLAVLAVVIMAVAGIRSSTSDPSLAVGAPPVRTTAVGTAVEAFEDERAASA